MVKDKARGNLIKEDILAINSLCGKVLQDTFGADSMLRAKLLPKLKTDCREVQISKEKKNNDCQTRKEKSESKNKASTNLL